MTDRRPPRIASPSQTYPRRARSVPAGRLVAVGVIGLIGIVALGSAIGGKFSDKATPSSNLVAGGASPLGSLEAVASATQPSPSPTLSGAPASPSPTTDPVTAATNIYGGAGAGMFSPAVASFPPRVYVPDEVSGTVVVIDPRTFKILYRYKVGASPEHVTPDWDLQRLYVEAAFGGRLAIIDPRTGRPVGIRIVPGPYNLYFTLDGRVAIVVRDSSQSGRADGGPKQLYFYDRRTWRLIKELRVPWAGADHLDFSADGSFFLLSTEYSGRLVKVDVKKMAIAGVLKVGGQPIDVRLAPDGRVFYVANQGRNGVSIIDTVHLRELAFVRTGRAAHGLAIGRDARWLYVTNRGAGSLSVIDFATRRVVHTWRIGGTPDMITVSPDGAQLWISNRYGGTVSVIDGHTGHVIKIIRVGGRPHGLTYFPQPGSISLGHNGIYR